MIVKDDGRAAPRVSGNMPTANIGISDDPQDQMMVLDILVNKLYTDKPAAILREYACNAADANVEAGKGDTPVDVRLPNKLDPTLAIRDYGAGMDEQQVQTVFCKLGRSTKRSSNEFTGMLGIGSKAGFAYGDQFLVTSFSRGIKTIYNAYRDKGFKLSSMFSEITTEPEGLEVKIPIREDDFENIRITAERVFRYFKVRPNVTGAKIEWADRAQEFSGTGWRFLGKRQPSVAIMGNVGYALDPQALELANAPPSLGTIRAGSEAILLRLGIELDFNIGDLEVASNREGLQYDDATKKVLITKLRVVISEIADILTGKIAKAKSLWEARLGFNALFGELDSIESYDLKRVIGKQILWSGKAIESNRFELFDYNNVDQDPDVRVRNYTRRGLTPAGGIRFSDYGRVHSIDATKSVALVLNDIAGKKNNSARIRGLFATTPGLLNVMVFTFNTAKAETEFLKSKGLEGAPFVKMSTIAPQVIPRIPGASSTPSAHRSKHTSRVFILKEPTPQVHIMSSRARSLWWVIDNVDLKKDDGIYVEIEGFDSIDPYQTPWNLLGSYKALKTAGLITGPIYGFKSGIIPKLGTKWMTLKDHVAKQWESLLKKEKNLLQEISDYQAALQYPALLPYEHATLFPVGTSIRALLATKKKYIHPKTENLAKAMQDRNVTMWMKAPLHLPIPSVKFSALEDKVMEDYPLIGIAGIHQLRRLTSAADLQPIIDYVKMVGRKRK